MADAEESARELNVPPEGFTALIENGRIEKSRNRKSGTQSNRPCKAALSLPGMTERSFLMSSNFTSMEPIRLNGDNLGKETPCPIEYRNIFIKEIDEGDSK